MVSEKARGSSNAKEKYQGVRVSKEQEKEKNS